MVALADLFVHLYVLIDDALKDGTVAVPVRPGPAPACSDAEVLTLTLARCLRGVTSENAWLTQVRADWGHYFPRVPHQSEFNRRTRWLRGAFELLRRHLCDKVPVDPWQQIDTTALPVMHPSRVRRATGWVGPGELVAGFGRDASHGEWFYGFRLALRTDLGSRLVRDWEITAATVDEREAARDLLDRTPPPAGLLLDRGFLSQLFHDDMHARGTIVLLAPGRRERQHPPTQLQRLIAAQRNRIETTNGEITENIGLAHHRAHTTWGLQTRTAAALCAHTIHRLGLT